MCVWSDQSQLQRYVVSILLQYNFYGNYFDCYICLRNIGRLDAGIYRDWVRHFAPKTSYMQKIVLFIKPPFGLVDHFTFYYDATRSLKLTTFSMQVSNQIKED